MTLHKLIPPLVLLVMLLASCDQSSPHLPSTPTSAPSSWTFPTEVPTASTVPTTTEVPTASTAPTRTPVPTTTPTLTPIPTYVKLRGEVIVDQAVCHYGPGKPYLYKYGVIKGSHLEVIARDERGIYIEVQAIGGNNPCWVKAEYMQIDGDVINTAPVRPEDVKLPQSPYYGPPASVTAKRSGSEVNVSWTALILKAGDSSEQVPYLIEAWVCQGGELLFTPLGFYETTARISDEPGCSEPSRARLFAAEKHGYTRWLQVPWPPAP